MINFLQTVPIEPQPGFMQQYSFIIMIGLMVLVPVSYTHLTLPTILRV